MLFPSLESFMNHFHDEDSCSLFLFQLKWPQGFRCSECSSRRAYAVTTRRLPLFECAGCKRQHSLTTGTVMENSRTPLRKWFIAIYLASRAEGSVSALCLSHAIQVTYKTAWLMLHKLRDSLGQSDCTSLLHGIVRIQGGAYGSPFNPYTEKDPQRHPLLAGGSLQENGEVSNLKLAIVDPKHIQHNGHISHISEQAFIQSNVSSGATDVQSVRFRLHMSRYRPLVQCIAEFCKWANDTFHGLGRQYLQAYANEFTFRYNILQEGHSLLARTFQLCTNTTSVPSLRSLTTRHRIA